MLPIQEKQHYRLRKMNTVWKRRFDSEEGERFRGKEEYQDLQTLLHLRGAAHDMQNNLCFLSKKPAKEQNLS